MRMQSILIIGGDKRQLVLYELLKEKGYDIYITGFGGLGIADQNIDNPDFVFLPVPYKDKNGEVRAPYAKAGYSLANIIKCFPKSVYVLGGCDDAAKKLFGQNISYIDLLRNEAFLIENAILTAEAAVSAYIANSQTALCGAKCIVVGYGRISKFLCKILQAYSAEVTATARKEKDIALIRGAGLRAQHTKNLKFFLCGADVIFNTVPCHIFLEEELKSIRGNAKIIELASPPFGMDMNLAKRLGVNVTIESSLPGRYFPVSAAHAILRAFESEEY